ncbi:hypothetical protein, partial [Ruegeria sp. Ofav3-42]|uniref:hypothetical protein n=1 Tax=Ruegeria sp. Ofav3-42 TaxID=2917759 RepID=UPI001EF41D13
LACFLFLDHLDDLFVGESRLHLSVLKLGGLYTKLEEIQGLRSRHRASVRRAAKGPGEPNFPNAARCANVGFSRTLRVSHRNVSRGQDGEELDGFRPNVVRDN